MTTAAVLHPTVAPAADNVFGTLDRLNLSGTTVYIAPARFDVHAIAALERWADEALTTADEIVVDLRMVDFVDHHMINELDRLRADAARCNATFHVANLSAAAALTFELIERAAA